MGKRDIWDEIELVGKGEHLEEEMFEYLSAYADGECTAKERRLVEAYLAESAEAREQLAEMRMQSAMAAEGFVDPPEWLRSAIMAKTVDRPRFSWAYAAGFATAAACAATLAIYLSVPTDVAAPSSSLLATNVKDEPTFEPPMSITPDVGPAPASVDEPKGSDPDPMVGRNRVIRQEAPPTIQASRTIKQPEEPSGGTSVSPPAAAASEEPDPEVTYAVADHGGGRFESRQPDVFDSEPSSAEPPKTASGTPAVLPDAREKLRDKVRKMNEEKLEIEGTEK